METSLGPAHCTKVISKGVAKVSENLPPVVDSTAVVAVCWNFIKTSLYEQEDSTHVHCCSLLFHFAYSRAGEILHDSNLSQETLIACEKLVSRLEELFFPHIFLLFERLKFFHRVRGSAEKEEDFLKTLLALAETCEFGAERQVKVREQFVHSGKLQPALIKVIEESSTCSLQDLLNTWQKNHKEFSCSDKDIQVSIGKQIQSPLEVKENADQKFHKESPDDGLVDDVKSSKRRYHAKLSPKSRGRRRKKFTRERKDDHRTFHIKHEGARIRGDSLAEGNNLPGNIKTHVDISNILDESQPDGGDDLNISEKVELQILENVRPLRRVRDSPNATKPTEVKKKRQKFGTEDVFDCKLCGKQLPSYYKLRKHLDSHSCSCVLCGDGYIHPSTLPLHMSKHLGMDFKPSGRPPKRPRSMERKSDYSCSTCKLTFDKKRFYTEHMRTHKYHCELCNKTLINKSAYTIHMNGHAGVKPLQCPQCPLRFTRKGDLNFHIRNHDPNRKKDNICHICGSAFYRIYELRRHITLHTGETPHVCPTCGKGFIDKTTCERHIRTHTGIKPFTCEKCGRSFVQQANLDAHRQRHHGPREEYACPLCGVKFAKKFYLNPHIHSHYVDNPFKCEICGACFRHRSGLKRHRYLHTGLKTFICEICHKAFPFPRSLNRHMRVHDPNRVKFLRPWEKVERKVNMPSENNEVLRDGSYSNNEGNTVSPIHQKKLHTFPEGMKSEGFEAENESGEDLPVIFSDLQNPSSDPASSYILL